MTRSSRGSLRALAMRSASALFLVLAAASGAPPARAEDPLRARESAPRLDGTAALVTTDDMASRIVDGVDKFLLRELERSADGRARHWQRNFSSPAAYTASVEPNRKHLAHILGARDPRVSPVEVLLDLEVAGSLPRNDAQGAATSLPRARSIRWSAFGGVTAEGILLEPRLAPGQAPMAVVVALPDADQLPELICGLEPVAPSESRWALRLAESGCTVIVPTLISRAMEQRRGALLTHREFLYRAAYELGRHIVGYEAQKVLAAVDAVRTTHLVPGGDKVPIGVCGYGEGGLVALAAGALDPRIDAVLVSGFFNDRRNVWQEPIDRNVFGLLDQFGDAEMASLVTPRALVIEGAKGPELTLPGKGGAPARLVTPRLEDVRREVERAKSLVRGLEPPARIELVVSGAGDGPAMSEPALRSFLATLAPAARLAPAAPAGSEGAVVKAPYTNAPARMARQVQEIDRHNQELLAGSQYVRQEFMKRIDTTSAAAYEKTSEEYRKVFRDDVIGRFDVQPLPPNPSSRQAYDKGSWRGYEVTLDVFPDVIAYGILLLPKDLQPGERRPVVVCQHGLEGRPRDVVEGDVPAYHDFAARLAERGFITFAPQNLYIFGDRFRTLQRKANPLGKTLFSIIVPQHQQIVDWLKSLPFVDPARIGFYGLSYGGKSAMRIPALVPDYCLSICSADFNEWVWKNASTRSTYSYIWSGEYEIFEFDLGSTFNYAEMAALIAPRPFMVERGHFDGVAPDETVAFEYAKVRFLYEARLGIGDRTEIEWFTGPHTINGKGTFEFLHRHLKWPAKR